MAQNGLPVLGGVDVPVAAADARPFNGVDLRDIQADYAWSRGIEIGHYTRRKGAESEASQAGAADCSRIGNQRNIGPDCQRDRAIGYIHGRSAVGCQSPDRQQAPKTGCR